MNSLLHILCRRGGGIHAKIDLPVQKAVFVSDHKVSLGTIFGAREPQPLRILGDVEKEICGVGFARRNGSMRGVDVPTMRASAV